MRLKVSVKHDLKAMINTGEINLTVRMNGNGLCSRPWLKISCSEDEELRHVADHFAYMSSSSPLLLWDELLIATQNTQTHCVGRT